ncbi:hypothetical protein ANCCAN_02936 [Ancylostoma caninum]|uniref:Uncharacterized protein n=1 Tax=Ancylostoma caninum TaxID=29170 RepID=A0A368H2T6_ANCCA|nr:hypothetical protein ANCCAN_02936 [Ancylostoma caninum]
MAYSNGFLAHARPWGFLSLCLFIAMYGMNTAVLTLHFVYRYFIICSGKIAILLRFAPMSEFQAELQDAI